LRTCKARRFSRSLHLSERLCGEVVARARSSTRRDDCNSPPPAKARYLEIAHMRGGWEEQVRLIILGLVGGDSRHSTRETKTKRTESTIEHAPKIPTW